ncbi:hypothetical protein EVAR_61684_1 [Eumeta japonica]|uniref:Uncharacterized protein n=1 Tax=Eumeta variegata TaxID=151549 RepID=A0A4C2A107_EUMVA|nr:hypothetical protein EVAR_61684_1 [Eumeta japonica]
MLRLEGHYSFGLLLTGEIVNSDLYCQQLMRLKQEVEKIWPELINRKVSGSRMPSETNHQKNSLSCDPTSLLEAPCVFSILHFRVNSVCLINSHLCYNKSRRRTLGENHSEPPLPEDCENIFGTASSIGRGVSRTPLRLRPSAVVEKRYKWRVHLDENSRNKQAAYANPSVSELMHSRARAAPGPPRRPPPARADAAPYSIAAWRRK